MVEEIDKITKDERTIYSIVLSDNSTFEIGTNIDEIWAYDEWGEMAYVPWFALIKNGNVRERINGAYVRAVRYAPS